MLVTLADPADADADADAATLIAVAATDSTALTVIHTTGVEGNLPLPGSTVMRGRQERPWMVHSINADTAILTDLAGGVIQVALTALHPDQVDSATNPTPPRTTHTANPGGADPGGADPGGADRGTQGLGTAHPDISSPDLG